MREITKGWQDFWAEFFRIKYQHLDEPAIEKEVVSHIIHTLSLRKGNRILDLACGEGSKTLELACRGMNVVGVDIAKVLVDYGNKAAQKENLPVKLIKGDMRDARFNDEFDTCTVISSFGLFDDSGNLKVLQAVEKALKHGGKFYIDLLNPFTRIKEREERWEEVENGYLLMKYNHNLVTGKMRITSLYITKEGNLIKSKHDELVRLYTLPEMIKLIETAKLVFKGAYGSFSIPLEEYSVTSDSMIIVGEKP
ncbi:class I SAM-dependent methyltransferase [candidate division WOR-3 bacterium]|nr:class I SAM-dependent methyltransferase [candidate division WOR-3 bacterium]